MRFLVTLLLLLQVGTIPLAADETPTPPPTPVNGTVTLTLDRWLQLTRPGKRPLTPGGGPGAPVPYLFSHGDYRVSVVDRFVRVEASLSLSVYQPGWVPVTLFSQPVILESAGLDGGSLLTRAGEEEGGLVALVNRPGPHRLKLVYYLPLSLSGATRSFALVAPSSAVTSVSLSVPGRDVEVVTNPKIPLETRSKNESTLVFGSLPGGNEEAEAVSFSWTPLAAHPALRGKPRQEKPRVYARLFTLATVGERDVRVTSQVQLSILRNSLDRLVFDVPAGVEVLDVQCNQLAGWSQANGTVEVRLAEGVSGEHAVTLIYERPLEGESTWNLPGLTMRGAERVKGSVGVVSTGGVEITAGGLQEARAIDVRELPVQVCALTANPVMLAYEYHQQPYQIGLVSKKGEEIPVLNAAIERGQGLTLLTEEGKLVTCFTYTMRNNRRQFLEVTLPVNATLYGAFVNDKPVKPIQDEGQKIRIPLVSPAGSFPIELTYVQAERASSWLGTGSSALTAPQLDVPISGLSWAVYIPTDRSVFTSSGTLTPGPLGLAQPALADDGAALEGATAASSAPAAQSRRAVGGAGEKLNVDQYLASNARLANMVRSASQGAFPVRLEIPKQGQVMEFSQLMVTGEAPTLLVRFTSPFGRTLAWALCAALLTLVGLALVRRPAGWKVLAASCLLLTVAGEALEWTGLLGALWLAWWISLLGYLASQRAHWQDSFQLWRHRRSLATLLVLACTLGARAEAPGGGTVTVPLADFMRLVGAGTAAPVSGGAPAAPAAWLWTRGDYRLEAGSRAHWAKVVASLDLTVLHKGWQEVDLLPGEVVLKQALLDGRPVPVYPKEGRYRGLVRGLGSHRLTLEYHLPVAGEGANSSVQLVTPESPASVLHLSLPAGVRLTATPPLPLTSRSLAGRTLAEGSFTSGSVALSWTPTAASGQLRGREQREKPRLTARVYTLLSVSDSAVRCKSRVDFTILRNEVDTLALLVPADVEVADVTCPNLAGWTTADRGAQRQVTLALSQPASGQLSVVLSLERGLAKADSTWDVPALEVPGVERIKGSLGMETSGGIEISAAGSGNENVRAIDVAELPSEVSELCSNPTVLAFEYHRQPFRLAVETRKGKEVAVLTATVDQARGTTLVTSEGKRITRLVLSVRNNHEQFLDLTLPPRATVFSAFVNGKPVKPVKGDNGKIRLRLETSSADTGQMAAFPAEVTYGEEAAVTPWLGRLAVAAPRVSMPISELGWELYLPTDWSVLGTGASSMHSVDPGSLAPLLDPQPPQGAAGALEDGKNEYKNKAADELRQQPRPSAGMQQMISAAQSGVLPVKVDVPRVGQCLAFRRLMVTDEVPVMQVTLTSSAARRAMGWMVFGLALAIGAWLAIRPRGWVGLVLGLAACWALSLALPALLLPLLHKARAGLELGLVLWLLNHAQLLLGVLPWGRSRAHQEARAVDSAVLGAHQGGKSDDRGQDLNSSHEADRPDLPE